MAIEAIEFRGRPRYSPEPRQHQKKGSAFEGSWRRSEIARWFGKAISFNGLLKAVDQESPPIIYDKDHLPREIQYSKDPRLAQPTQPVSQIVGEIDRLALEAVGKTADLNHIK